MYRTLLAENDDDEEEEEEEEEDEEEEEEDEDETEEGEALRKRLGIQELPLLVPLVSCCFDSKKLSKHTAATGSSSFSAAANGVMASAIGTPHLSRHCLLLGGATKVGRICRGVQLPVSTDV